MRADDWEFRKAEGIVCIILSNVPFLIVLLHRIGIYKTIKKIYSPENTMRDNIDDLEEAIERKRAFFAAKAEKRKRKLRESHGGK